MIRRALAILTMLAVAALGLFDLAGAVSAAPLSALSVSGNHLVNASGQTVTLRGADESGTEFVCAQNWTADPFGGQPETAPQTIAAMQSWDINVVRIPLNEDCWLGINGVEIGGAAYQSAIKTMVSDYTAAGIYVILDLHWSAPGTQRALSQNPAPDEDHSPAFWTSVASTFGGNQGVLFDLYNEPYFYWLTSGENAWQCLWQGCTLSEYVTGGSPYTVNANWTTAGYDQLTSDVRGTGATNVIMAGCVDWANDCSGWASSFASYGSGDANTVVAWHAYPGEGCSTVACFNSVIAPLAAKYSVIVGETGDSVSVSTFLPTFLPWAASNGLSVVAWTWNAWGDANDILVTNMETGTPTDGEGVTYEAWLKSFGGPSPTAAPTPTPSPTATPTAVPTPTPMVAPTPTPTAVPTPTPTALPTPTPTPAPGVSFTETIAAQGHTCSITVTNGVVSGTCT